MAKIIARRSITSGTMFFNPSKHSWSRTSVKDLQNENSCKKEKKKHLTDPKKGLHK